METITEDYVSFEVAKLLKKKGFDEICYLGYNKNGEYFPTSNRCNSQIIQPDFCLICCPTLQMAMKWLRKTYNIHIVLSPNKKMNNQYSSIIFVDKEGELHPQPTDFFHGSYEEAAETAIKNCLENLI